jgi:predicted AAA+ superfamily ATPase
LGGRRVLLINEAQKIPDIGSILKLMIDDIEELRIVATASSAFDIHNVAGDPLMGRKSTLRLFAVSEQEFSSLESLLDARDN